MREIFAAAAAVMAVLAGGTAAAEDARDTFDGPPLNPELWDICQAAPELLSFGREGTRAFLVLAIDGERGNVENCSTPAPADTAEMDRLGPTFIAPERQPASLAAYEASCFPPETSSGKPLVQRNELRFLPQEKLHPVDQAHWYSLTFKAAADGGTTIPDCGSARWVIAQWKYAKGPDGGSDGPFLAQRFDNGVLHVTIEDGLCRCMVAKAEGDPFRTAFAAQLMVNSRTAPLHPVPPLACKSTREGFEDGLPCAPANLKLYSTSATAIPGLPDPKADWVRMSYHVLAHGPNGARIDVYANGQFIVRAEGHIASALQLPNRVKFKFGHYRDKIPVKTRMLVDEVCLAQSAANCGLPAQAVRP